MKCLDGFKLKSAGNCANSCGNEDEVPVTVTKNDGSETLAQHCIPCDFASLPDGCDECSGGLCTSCEAGKVGVAIWTGSDCEDCGNSFSQCIDETLCTPDNNYHLEDNIC